MIFRHGLKRIEQKVAKIAKDLELPDYSFVGQAFGVDKKLQKLCDKNPERHCHDVAGSAESRCIGNRCNHALKVSPLMKPLRTVCLVLSAGLFFVLMAGSPLQAVEKPADLVTGLKPLASVLAGREHHFDVSGRIDVPVDGKQQSIEFSVVRYDDECFDLALTHLDFAVVIRRRADITAMALPKHDTVFIGRGDVDSADSLQSRNIISRLISQSSTLNSISFGVNLLAVGDLDATLNGILSTASFEHDAAAGTWKSGDATISFPAENSIDVRADEVLVSLTTRREVGAAPPAEQWPGMKITELPRQELERTLVRGVRRATEVLKPGPDLVKPQMTSRSTEHGQLRWIDGQRIALLWGTPEEIGTAHGELLADESRRCIESVLYSFGTANVVRTGRWFRQDLQDACARLSPHIPERHKVETRALAAAMGLEPDLVEALNVFPELFHCSGFAVFGSATKDGKLYHGRVLDYMTTIGLQDSATTFIIQPKGQFAFANVGYAGFIGSVSGMNAEGISLGEMGGRGEGQWDGAPMATLMRRALEECDTLAEVQTLWTESPRTCEYYYVFADGKTNEAVGVAATPESIEFIMPGQNDERLGEGIKDAVVMSAGSRLEELRRRVTEKHGQLDTELGQWLMSRPVAMQSNLHNVLMVPADGVLYVANAGHDKPAAEMPYVKIDLRKMLSEIPGEPRPTRAARAK